MVARRTRPWLPVGGGGAVGHRAMRKHDGALEGDTPGGSCSRAIMVRCAAAH